MLMTKHSLLVLVANSAHARVLRQGAGSDGLHTCLTIENGPVRGEARSAPHPNERRDERIHQFVAVLGAHLRALLAEHPAYGLVLAAPSRMLAPLKDELAATGALRATAAKDLVKFHDNEVALHLAAELRLADGGFAAA
jgi:hypothetical protein